MELLDLISGTMSTDSSVEKLKEKTGGDSDQVSKFVDTAVPTLISFMTKNASDEDGARSLAGALGQHTDDRSMSEMIGDADEEDGGKIIHHILGDKEESVVEKLSEETGMDSSQVEKGLGSIAPALLSSMFAAGGSGSSSSGSGLSSLLGLLGGGESVSSSSGGILESLLGDGSSYGLGSMLGSMFGESSGSGNIEQLVETGSGSNQSSFNGSSLMSLLSAFLK